MPQNFPVYASPADVVCFHCGIQAKDARPYRAGANAAHNDSGFPAGRGRYRFTCQCGRHTYYDLTPRVHLFDFRGQALCGSSNQDDGDEPASHDPAEVTCDACKAKWLARHRAADPHCTCNDCIQWEQDQETQADA